MLTIDAVRRSIEALQKPFIHEQFLAYLHLRKRSVEEGTLTGIEPVWTEVGRLLAVEGGPPNKPNYRPISSRTKHDLAGYWLNPNIPGSYAPSSVRRVSRFMLDVSGSGFSLPPDHAEQALKAHLDNQRPSAWSFAGFFLRDYGFDRSASTAQDLIDGFCDVFRFESTAPGSDFDTLFTIGNEPDIVWFELLVEMSASTSADDEESADD